MLVVFLIDTQDVASELWIRDLIINHLYVMQEIAWPVASSFVPVAKFMRCSLASACTTFEACGPAQPRSMRCVHSQRALQPSSQPAGQLATQPEDRSILLRTSYPIEESGAPTQGTADGADSLFPSG